MINKKIFIDEIISFLGCSLKDFKGDLNNKYVFYLKPSDKVDKYTLDWINPNRVDKQLIVEKSRAKIILCDDSIYYSSIIKDSDKVLLIVDNPKVQIAKVAKKFFVVNKPPSIDMSSVVDSSASLGNDISIGSNCSIGNCTIGDNTVIEANVVIYDNVKIGANCIIKSGAILGGEGFGFEKDEDGHLFRFPQIGNLIIEDFVEVGANTCIDRGALSDTYISHHTKINNLCHIAHNVFIGSNTIITGCVNVSGSTKIGSNVWIAPNCTVRGWINIGNNVTIGMGSVVVKSIHDGETWYGAPAKKIK